MFLMADNMQSRQHRQENAVQETTHACPSPDRDPAQDEPTSESITRAWAAQQRERATFTELTGVRVGIDGRILRRRAVPDTHARMH